MNCYVFESNINDLARDHVMDAAVKTRALAHAQVCGRCAARLADERMLTAGLRRLSASAADEQAPARVEEILRAAFNERHAQAAPRPSAHAAKRALRWAVAASVAAIIALVAFAALRFEKPSPPAQAHETTQPSPPRLAERPEEAHPAAPTIQVQAPTAAPNRRPAANRPARPATRDQRDKKDIAKANKPGGAAGINEIATDFIPLMHAESLDQMDGGQIVRVELPRSALMSFGLPMNMERADERIKADVVIGNDGLARAIRFVR